MTETKTTPAEPATPGSTVSDERLTEVLKFAERDFNFWGPCHGKDIARDTIAAIRELQLLRTRSAAPEAPTHNRACYNECALVSEGTGWKCTTCHVTFMSVATSVSVTATPPAPRDKCGTCGGDRVVEVKTHDSERLDKPCPDCTSDKGESVEKSVADLRQLVEYNDKRLTNLEREQLNAPPPDRPEAVGERPWPVPIDEQIAWMSMHCDFTAGLGHEPIYSNHEIKEAILSTLKSLAALRTPPSASGVAATEDELDALEYVCQLAEAYRQQRELNGAVGRAIKNATADVRSLRSRLGGGK